MIDCSAAHARKKLKCLSLLLLSHTFVFVFPLWASLSVSLLLVASPEAIPSPGPTAYIASCLVASSLRSPPYYRLHLVESLSSHFPKMLLCRSRTSCTPGVTFDAVRVSRVGFFYLKSFHQSFNRASPALPSCRRIKLARDTLRLARLWNTVVVINCTLRVICNMDNLVIVFQPFRLERTVPNFGYHDNW